MELHAKRPITSAGSTETGRNNYQLLIDFIEHPAAVVDENGLLVAVNERWSMSSESILPSDNQRLLWPGVGLNYFQSLNDAGEGDGLNTSLMSHRVRELFRGERSLFQVDCNVSTAGKGCQTQLSGALLPGTGNLALLVYKSVPTEPKPKPERPCQGNPLRSPSFGKAQLQNIDRLSPGRFFSLKATKEGEMYWTYVSPKFAELFGLDRKEFHNDPMQFGARVHPDDLQRITKSMTPSVEHQTEWHEEFRVQRADATIIWLDVYAQPYVTEEGELEWIGIAFDITKRKEWDLQFHRAQQRLAESEALYRTLVTKLETPCASLDRHGRFLLVNTAFARIFGIAPEQLVGKNFADVLDPSLTESRMNILRKVATEKVLYSDEAPVPSNGQVRYYKRSFQPVLIDGEVAQILIIGQDITESKLHAEQQYKYALELEQKVVERTSELREALGKEKELAEMKGKFVNMASHEFRTPLATISLAAGFVRRYRSQLSMETIIDKVKSIEEQVYRMTALLDDILVIGKSESGKLQTVLQPILLCPFVDSILHELNELHPSHTIDTSCSCNVDWVTTDEKLIRHIIINLINNAIKFSPGKTNVSFSMDCTPEYLEFIVTDHGIGIPEEERQHLFEPFFRGQNATTIQGTGLGLSIVKKSVELLNGVIQFHSTPGEGSTFLVRLPQVKPLTP